MSFITESELRELWQNGRGELPAFPPGTRFSAAASDFLKSQHLTIQTTEPLHSQAAANKPEWDNPGAFPVILSGPIPVCLECGQPLHSKPQHMTQLDAGHFASKTHPRILLRGRMDSLNALMLLAANKARHFDLAELAEQMDTLAAYCREITSAEYNLRVVAPLNLMGMDEDRLHEISHHPDKQVGIPHLVPNSYAHEMLHWLNVLRTQAREVELLSLQVFPPGDPSTSPAGNSIPNSLNRLSSAVYVLELYFQSGKLGWKVKG